MKRKPPTVSWYVDTFDAEPLRSGVGMGSCPSSA